MRKQVKSVALHFYLLRQYKIDPSRICDKTETFATGTKELVIQIPEGMLHSFGASQLSTWLGGLCEAVQHTVYHDLSNGAKRVISDFLSSCNV
jgi:hypothetical protein